MTEKGKWRDRGCCLEEQTFAAITLTRTVTPCCRRSTGRRPRLWWVCRTLIDLISGGFRAATCGPGKIHSWSWKSCPVLRLSAGIVVLCLSLGPHCRYRSRRSPIGCRSSPSTPCFARNGHISHGTGSTIRPAIPCPKPHRGPCCTGTGRSYLRQTGGYRKTVMGLSRNPNRPDHWPWRYPESALGWSSEVWDNSVFERFRNILFFLMFISRKIWIEC